MSERAPRLVVHVRDGMITCIDSEIPLDVLVVDFDTDGADEDRLSGPDDDQACTSLHTPIADPAEVAKFWQLYWGKD